MIKCAQLLQLFIVLYGSFERSVHESSLLVSPWTLNIYTTTPKTNQNTQGHQLHKQVRQKYKNN